VQTHQNAAAAALPKNEKKAKRKVSKRISPAHARSPGERKSGVEENEKTLLRHREKKRQKSKSVPTSSSFSRVVFIVFIVVVVDFLFFFSRCLLLPRV